MFPTGTKAGARYTLNCDSTSNIPRCHGDVRALTSDNVAASEAKETTVEPKTERRTKRQLFTALLDALLKAEDRHLRVQTMLNFEQVDHHIYHSRRAWLAEYDAAPDKEPS